MNVRIEPLDDHTSGAWDSIVASSKFGTIFHSTHWLKLYLQADQMLSSPRFLVLLDDGNPVGVYAGSEYDFHGLKAFMSPAPRSWTYYGGLVVSSPERGRTHELWRVLMSSLLKNYTIVVSTDPPSMETLGWCEQQTARKTLVVRLSLPVEKLWSRIREGRRREIRKAEREGVLVVEGDRPDDVQAYYEMLKQTRDRKRFRTILPFRFYANVLHTLGQNRAKLFLAVYRNEPVAGVFLLNDSKRLYYWSGASNEAGLRLGANSLVHWKAILFGRERGLSEYDMLGANIPSVASFKAGFGGEYRKFYSSIMAHPNLLAGVVRWYLARFSNFGSSVPRSGTSTGDVSLVGSGLAQ